jgi:hypothetical protein
LLCEQLLCEQLLFEQLLCEQLLFEQLLCEQLLCEQLLFEQLLRLVGATANLADEDVNSLCSNVPSMPLSRSAFTFTVSPTAFSKQ